MNNNKSVIYVNYSPYENSGHILDYLREEFKYVFLFSLAFHKLKGKKSANKLSIYKMGKLIGEEYLHYLAVPDKLSFFFLPLRSTINFIQILLKILELRAKYGNIDLFFTVNAFTASIGRVLKWFSVVKKSIFWVWDYYPFDHPKITFKIMRWLYWQFDKFATFSDGTYYLNHRLADVRKKSGLLPSNYKSIDVPIGTGKHLPIKKKNLKNIKIGFIGVLKKSQGVDMLIDSAEILSKNFGQITFEIIGSGPDGDEFKRKVQNFPNITYNFYGYVDDDKFKKILYNCTIGASPYTPGEGTVSKYTDPGKPKRYIEFNLPVITTDVIELSKIISKSGAGLVIKYGDNKEFAKAIKSIVSKYDKFSKNAQLLNRAFYYRDIYPKMFEIIGK